LREEMRVCVVYIAYLENILYNLFLGGLGGTVVVEGEKWSNDENEPRFTLAPGPAMLWRVAEGLLGFAPGLPMLVWGKGVINKAKQCCSICSREVIEAEAARDVRFRIQIMQKTAGMIQMRPGYGEKTPEKSKMRRKMRQ